MKKIISLLILCALLLTICGCGKGEQFKDYSFDSFDTVTTIIGYEKNREDFDSNCKIIKQKLFEYHKLYNIYNRYEDCVNLAELNESGGEEVSVPSEIIDMLLLAKEMYSLTNGKCNIAMGNLLSLWHDCREEAESDPANAKLPEESALKSAAEQVSIDDVVIDKEKGTVTLKNGVLLDVGAVAKGYAVERVAEWMEENGMSGYVLNVGGNVRTIGEKPSGERWTVGIENPDTENEDEPYIEYLQIADRSLVTSGSYQRFYTVGGKNYHHIIDPATLYPAEYFLSVSVLTKDSGLADALSTALFTMPYEEGRKLVESLDDVEAMWVSHDGEKSYSANFSEYFLKEK